MIVISFLSIVRDIMAKTATKVEISLIFSFFIRHYVFSKRLYGYHSNTDTS